MKIYRAVLEFSTDDHACYECGRKYWQKITSDWYTTREAAENEFDALQAEADAIKRREMEDWFGYFEQREIEIEESEVITND